MAIFPILLLLLAHIVLTALPGSAAALIGARRGIVSIPVLLNIWLSAGGVLAMLGFWLYYAEPWMGKMFSFAVMAGSAAAITRCLTGGRPHRTLLRQLATPLTLWALGSVFVVCIGFAHGGTDAAIPTAAYRFTTAPLPSDNDIPQFYLSWFYLHGHAGVAPIYPPNWLSSDRPPLQIGYELLQRPFGWDTKGLNYQLVAVTLQQFWIMGLWALLLAARLGRITRALAMIAVLVSGLTIVNGFFVWPKLLSAGMLLGAAALVLTPLWDDVRRRAAAAALVAALVALAMLGHGSSVFGVIPLVVLAIYRHLPSWRWIAVGVGVGIVLMVPWSLYQKYGDPPGNRLTKWMLAGDTAVNEKSAVEDIAGAYEGAGLARVVHNKVENLLTVVGAADGARLFKNGLRALGDGHLGTAIQQARALIFFSLLPSFGLLLVAPLLMLVARWQRRMSGDDWAFACTGLVAVAIAVLAWILILFGNEMARTTIHVGSFAVPIIGYSAAVAGLRAAYPRLAIYLVSVWGAISLAVYVPSYSPQLGMGYHFAPCALGALSVAAFAAVAVRGARPEPAEPLVPSAVSGPA